MSPTDEELHDWVLRGESETQEFKIRSSASCRRAAAETICAMLNTRGGRVLFGVTPQAEVLGQQTGDKTIEEIVAELSHIDPPASPEVSRVALSSGQEVIVASVGKSHRRPHSYKGKTYRRIGNTTTQISRDQYHEMLLEAHHANHRWESETAEGWAVSDLDSSEISRTVDEAVRRGRLDEPGTRDPREMLRGLGLLPDGRLTRAAVVLFGRADRLPTLFPQCRVRLARFRGTDKTEFIDNRQFHGNAFDLLLRADQFLRTHLPVAGRIVSGVFERSDDPIYPPLALREALANALCHRDYSIGGGSVGIAVYDDRLEITSSGGLHFGLQVADLYESHESLPWNPTIADVFFRRGIIETWGRGTLKMTQLTQLAGLPRPEFEDSSGALLVRFRPSSYQPPQRVGRDLSEQQQTILEVLASGGEQALNVIVRALDGADRRHVQTDLQFLRSLDLVRSSGWGRGARWQLAEAKP